MNRTFLLLALLSIPLFAMACKSDSDTPSNPNTPSKDVTTCLGCHSDEATLKAVADPNPPAGPSEGGCGGTLPEMAAWEKVYIGGDNGAKFLASTHGRMACVSCHGGTEPAANKLVAHATNFVGRPSLQAEKYCGTCHKTIASKDRTSIHTQGLGQKKMLCDRGAYADSTAWPDQLRYGYNKNCGKCHSSCGECHVQRPRQAGGGFLEAHNFKLKPDMRLNCTACHSARVAHAYFGEGFGLRPDVHYLNMPGGQCTNCHSANEMHGTGVPIDQRYSVTTMPKCEGCHGGKSTANAFHAKHWNDLACQVCHSQDYQNCGSCHVDDGVRNGPYISFKIGLNPLPQTKRFKYVVLRNAPHAPDTWSNYGVPTLTNFNVHPTWRLASPHNIKRWTPRTEVEQGKPCFDACHITQGRNAKWFLFDADLKESWEKTSNSSVVVDGKLPAGWSK